MTSTAPRTSPCSGIPLILQIDQAPHTTITVVAIILAYVMNSPERANAIEVHIHHAVTERHVGRDIIESIG